MNIPLSVLVEAVRSFDIVRHAAATGKELSPSDYQQTLIAYWKLRVEVDELLAEMNVEVKA
jgi:hypothetical protein